MKKPFSKYEKLITGLIIGTAVGGAVGMGMHTKKGKEIKNKVMGKVKKSSFFNKSTRVLKALLFGKKDK